MPFWLIALLLIRALFSLTTVAQSAAPPRRPDSERSDGAERRLQFSCKVCGSAWRSYSVDENGTAIITVTTGGTQGAASVQYDRWRLRELGL
jgi:hypothetical protein